MKQIAFYHSHQVKYKSQFGAAVRGSNVDFCIDTQRTLPVKQVFLVFNFDGRPPVWLPLTWQNVSDDYDTYGVNVTIDFPETILFYYFKIIDYHDKTYYIGPKAPGHGGECAVYPQEPPGYQLSLYDKSYKTPAWFRSGVTYHVFVDRFCRSGQTNIDQSKYVLHENLNDTPQYLPDENAEITNTDVYGGTLRGVIEKLDYLQTLCVKTIYLSPIFEAYSNHKYNTGDYLTVDPCFGTQDDFIALCQKAKAYDIHIMLDGVFSHTGSDSIYFNRNATYASLGAYQSQQSPYYDWYTFEEYPEKYNCWWGIKTLPVLNKRNQKYLDFIIHPKHGVLAKWTTLGADGWRLDVADELPDDFIFQLRKTLKGVKKSALLLGEVWEDASNKISYSTRLRYLGGQSLDGVMNYPVKDAIIAFLKNNISAYDFYDTIMTLKENYPPPAFESSLNILGTHDTMRILTVLGLDNFDYTRQQKALHSLNRAQLETAIARLKQASVIQYFMPGSPCIYYGDEAGLQGFEDPFNRRFFPWDNCNQELVKWYQMLGQLKTNLDPLKSGELFLSAPHRDVLILQRKFKRKEITAVINRGTEPFVCQSANKKKIDMIHQVTYLPNTSVTIGAHESAILY